jgi:3-hydroxybutyryl-CoA dehydrogenase
MTVQLRPPANAPVIREADGPATALVFASLNRALCLLASGYASAADIDTAMSLGCGLPQGPFAMLERVGFEAAHDILTGLYRKTGDPAFRPAPLLTNYHGSGPNPFSTRRRQVPPDPLLSRSIERAGVCGTGTMARGIAEVLVTAGISTVLVSRDAERAAGASERVAGSLAKAAAKGRMTEAERDHAVGLLDSSGEHAAVREADLVVDAVVEDLPVKRALFARLGRICRPGAILATTTSSLPLTECAEASRRPFDVVGLHFFNPAPAMRLVELVHLPVTRPEVLGTARSLCARLGKTTVECADRTGLIVNYLLLAYLNRAIGLLGEGADATTVDDAVRDEYGYPLGPFALLDLIGLDVSLATLRRLYHAFPEPDFLPDPELERLVAAGRLGRKTGYGFHPPR